MLTPLDIAAIVAAFVLVLAVLSLSAVLSFAIEESRRRSDARAFAALRHRVERIQGGAR